MHFASPNLRKIRIEMAKQGFIPTEYLSGVTKPCFIAIEPLSDVTEPCFGAPEYLFGATEPCFVMMELCFVATEYLSGTIAPITVKFCNGDRR